MTSQDDQHSGCGAECFGRRVFFREAVSAAAVLVGLSALTPMQQLSALELRRASGLVHYPIPAADGVSIDTKNEVILARSKGEMYAFALSCPHQNTAIRALPGAAGFQCPRHKSRYQPDGTFINGKATRNMDRLAITRDGANVVVDVEKFFQSDEQPKEWVAAVVKL